MKCNLMGMSTFMTANQPYYCAQNYTNSLLADKTDYATKLSLVHLAFPSSQKDKFHMDNLLHVVIINQYQHKSTYGHTPFMRRYHYIWYGRCIILKRKTSLMCLLFCQIYNQLSWARLVEDIICMYFVQQIIFAGKEC